MPQSRALILESVSPLTLEVDLNVQQELQERLAESDRLRHQYVERVQYEAEQSRVRYMRVADTHPPAEGTDSNGDVIKKEW